MPHAVSTTQITAAPRDVACIWQQIEAAVQESSVMRCEGRSEEAAAMLQQRMPALIREWSEGSGRSAEECREQLRELFTKAQAQVAEALFTRRLVLASMGRTDGPAIAPSGRVQLRRQVPIDDVVGMIDALREVERAGETAPRKTFPSAQSRLSATGLVA